MKGEYVESKNETPKNMFSKLHLPSPNPSPQPHPHPHQTQTQNHPFPHHFGIARESRTPESDDNSRNTALTSGGGGGGDGASIEVSRRPRGRPPGSKNKPKPPVIITREPEPAMSPYILEVQNGTDVVEALSRFSRRKNLGICILAGSGTVSNVTLRQPSTTPGATITFHGRFDILSLSATFLPQAASSSPVPNTVSISLAGPQGQIVGGFVGGPLIAVGTVYVIAATVTNPSYHRLPGEDEGRNPVTSSGGGGGEGRSQSPPMCGAESAHGGADSCGVSMYSCHLGGSDVIWTPTARPTHPPPF